MHYINDFFFHYGKEALMEMCFVMKSMQNNAMQI